MQLQRTQKHTPGFPQTVSITTVSFKHLPSRCQRSPTVPVMYSKVSFRGKTTDSSASKDSVILPFTRISPMHERDCVMYHHPTFPVLNRSEYVRESELAAASARHQQQLGRDRYPGAFLRSHLHRLRFLSLQTKVRSNDNLQRRKITVFPVIALF